VRGTCVGDLILNGFDNLILQAADPSPAHATVAGSVVTTLTKLALDRVDIAVSGDNVGLVCGGLSDCYLSESNITGASTIADGATITGRSRASLVASNVSGFRMGLYVNNGSTAGFIAAAGVGTISNVLDGVYTLDGSFVSVEGNPDGTRAQVVAPRRNGITAFASTVRTRRMDILSPGSALAGFGLELRSGAKAHVQASNVGSKAGVYPATGGAWPSVLLADLAHVYFVDGDPVALSGPVHCSGKYSSFDTFGSSVSVQSVGVCGP
jgi:hypothetical protein